MDRPRERLNRARLYLVCDAQPDGFLHAVLRAGVDLVQLRMKDADDADVVRIGRRFREICAEHEALLILNDRPDLVSEIGADGVHVGQDDLAVAMARELVGDARLVGLSTHSPEQIDLARGADYIGVGPVFETPTKPGRPAVGLALVRYAAAHAHVPWFAIGGLTPDNVASICEAGATRVAVVRALTEAPAPELVARRLRETLLTRRLEEAQVGAT